MIDLSIHLPFLPTHTNIYTHACTYGVTHQLMHIPKHNHTYMYANIHIHSSFCPSIQPHTHTQYIHTYVHTYIYTYMHRTYICTRVTFSYNIKLFHLISGDHWLISTLRTITCKSCWAEYTHCNATRLATRIGHHIFFWYCFSVDIYCTKYCYHVSLQGRIAIVQKCDNNYRLTPGIYENYFGVSNIILREEGDNKYR